VKCEPEPAVVAWVANLYSPVHMCGMPKRYSVTAARSNLPAIIAAAESGQVIELMRRGKPVAVVVSRREFDRLRGGRTRFVDAYAVFLETHSLVDLGLDPGTIEAARDESMSGRT
jgi:prevent-host-death family protein